MGGQRGRRFLGDGAQGRGIRRAGNPGQSRKAGVSLDSRRDGRDQGCGASVGQNHRRCGETHPRGARRPERPGRADRTGGRAPGTVRVHHGGPALRRRQERARGRHGIEEPEGRRGPGHEQARRGGTRRRREVREEGGFRLEGEPRAARGSRNGIGRDRPSRGRAASDPELPGGRVRRRGADHRADDDRHHPHGSGRLFRVRDPVQARRKGGELTAGRPILPMEVPSTRRSARSARTSASTTSRASPLRTRSATPGVSTRSPPECRSPS